MNFAHLRYAIEVEKTGSISQASKNLYMGQPNLSKAIKELEAELNISIFKRTAKGVVPTSKGNEFLSYAKIILSQMNELESLYKAPSNNMIDISISAPRATYVTSAFCEFTKKYEKADELNIHFKETTYNDAINDIISGESNIAVVRYQNIYESFIMEILASNELYMEPLWEYKMLVLMQESNPLSAYEDIPYHLLNDCIELVHGDFHIPPVIFSKIRKNISPIKAHKRIFVYDRGTQYDLLKSLDNCYMWVSPFPKDKLVSNGLITRPCSMADMVNKDIIIYKEKPDVYASEFVSFLKNKIKEMEV